MDTKPKLKNKPLSLYPLSVDEILEIMLHTPPIPKEKKQIIKSKRQKKTKLPKKQVT